MNVDKIECLTPHLSILLEHRTFQLTCECNEL